MNATPGVLILQFLLYFSNCVGSLHVCRSFSDCTGICTHPIILFKLQTPTEDALQVWKPGRHKAWIAAIYYMTCAGLRLVEAQKTKDDGCRSIPG